MKAKENMFLSDRGAYEKADAAANEVFQLGQRLPRKIFQSQYGDYCFLEADSAFAGDFWNALSTCADQFGDSEVYMRLVRPDPASYYYKHFKRYGVMKVNAFAAEEAYAHALFEDPGDSPADAFAYNSFVACWWGSTRQWGFWAERSANIAIGARLRTSRATWPAWPTLSSYREGETPFHDIEEALDIASLEFDRDPMAYERFKRAFMKNYG